MKAGSTTALLHTFMPGDVLFIPASCMSPALGLSGSPLQGQPDSLQVLPVFYKMSENGLG